MVVIRKADEQSSAFLCGDMGLFETAATAKGVGVLFFETAALLIFSVGLFPGHIAEVPGELQIDAGITIVLLMTPEGGTLGVVLELAGVEDVAPVEGQCEGLVEEGLAQTEVE